MANFPSIGVSAVVQNAAQYTQQINKVASDTDAAGQKIKGAATNTTAMGSALTGITNTISKFIPGLGQVGDMTGKMGEAFKQGKEAISTLGEAFGPAGEEIAALAIPIAVAAAALVGFFALAERGAGFSDIENAFLKLTSAAGTTANALLGKLHDASQGTIDDMELETITNQALLGVNADLQKSFGQDLPQMMQIARTVALATGQDTVSVFDSIEQAIKRGQTRGLQAIGIIVDQKKAYDDYAKSMDISVKSMTKADQEQALLNATLAAGKQLTDELGNSQESNATKMQQLTTTVTNALDSLSKMVQPIFGAILDTINAIVTPIGDAINQIAPYIEAIIGFVVQAVQAVDSFVSSIWNATIGPFVSKILSIGKSLLGGESNIFTGAAHLIGALAGGIIYAANTYVFPAVISIANFIADFLSGLSPPPMGPLHTIDQGGANVMLAWLEGATGVSLEPIQQVADNVNTIMGSVGTESLAQVKARLLELDNAIAPFQEQLDLVKTRFDEIKGVTTPAIDAIDKQISMLQQALASGDTAAAAQIKTLDAQKQKLQDYVDTQQMAVDNAQIQLALATLQQGAERETLTTRENILKTQQSLTTTTKQTTPKAAPKGKGAGATTGDTGGMPTLGGPTQLTDAQQAGQDMGDAFQRGVTDTAGDTGTAIMAANVGQLKAAGNKISAAVGNIGDQLNTALVKPFQKVISDIGTAINALFTPGDPNSIQTWLGKLPGAFMNLGANLETNLIAPFSEKVSEVVQFLLPGNPKSLWTKFAYFASTDLPAALSNLATNIESSLVAPFLEKVNGLIASIDTFFNDENADPGLHKIFKDVMAFFGTLPELVAGVLAGLGKALLQHLVNPIITGLNNVLSAIVSFINNTVIPAITKIQIAIGIAQAIAEGHPNSINIPGGTISGITFTPIPPAAASGGLFGPGLLQTHANELIAPAEKIGVFPANFVTALDRLTAVLMRPVTASTMYSTVTNSQTVNMYGIQGAQDAIREFARLQAVSAH